MLSIGQNLLVEGHVIQCEDKYSFLRESSQESSSSIHCISFYSAESLFKVIAVKNGVFRKENAL